MKQYTQQDAEMMATEIKELRKQFEDLRKRYDWSREDADMARIYMTKWQMAYEKESTERRKWREIARRLYNPFSHTEACFEYAAEAQYDETNEVES